MANLKSIVDLPLVESSEGLNLIVNDNGAAKQIAASKIGGGGGVTSWNDLSDRPFYTEVLETIEVTVPAKTDGGSPGACDLQDFPKFNAGEQIDIKINDVSQSLIAMDFGYAIALSDSLEEPTFAIIQDFDLIYAQNYTDQDIILSYNIEKIHPINQKYIPSGRSIPLAEFLTEFNMESPEQTISLSFEEWLKKIAFIKNPLNKITYGIINEYETLIFSWIVENEIRIDLIFYGIDEKGALNVRINKLTLSYNFETSECTLFADPETYQYNLSRYVPTPL